MIIYVLNLQALSANQFGKIKRKGNIGTIYGISSIM
jgi:hypothetical protein